MVILMRIDERMLHGQVALTWVNEVHPEAILIANDEAAENDMTKLALKVAKPADVKLAIKSVAEGAALLNNPKTQKIRIFVIVRTLADAVRLIRQTSQIHSVNIGGVRKKEGSRQLGNGVFLSQEDIADLKELHKNVETVEFRMVPSQAKIEYEKILEE